MILERRETNEVIIQTCYLMCDMRRRWQMENSSPAGLGTQTSGSESPRCWKCAKQSNREEEASCKSVWSNRVPWSLPVKTKYWYTGKDSMMSDKERLLGGRTMIREQWVSNHLSWQGLATFKPRLHLTWAPSASSVVSKAFSKFSLCFKSLLLVHIPSSLPIGLSTLTPTNKTIKYYKSATLLWNLPQIVCPTSILCLFSK